ncbi:MAG: hypothetical protein FIA95_15205 [Gemmatimonadetes bacterium]|nr:hypothetical protein [Gemmatimonadota bacterium]
MVARCLELDRCFGLLHHDADRQGPFLMEEGRVGCVARIEEFQPLPDGRSVLLVRGEGRFRIDDGIESGEPYYEALVSPYGDLEADTGLLERRTRTLALFREVLRVLGEEPDWVSGLDTSSELSFRLVRTVQTDPAWQQGFLEVQDEAARLELLDAVFLGVLGR